ncbi:MAG: DUF2490 domain-containing protein [Candidatus Latescibacterota bacterium]|nr:MAG: DUF2490 domain-containing protein [Candidatus Latescibacterota bacterium]
MILRVATIFLTIIILALTSLGDALAAEDQELLYSLGYTFQTSLKERLRGFASTIYEQQYAAGEIFGTQNELDIYGGVTFDLKERIRIEGGLGYYYIHRDVANNTHELRLWQSGTLDWPESLGLVRRFVIHHRFRIEERFRNNQENGSLAFRFRYRLAFAFPFNRYTVEPGAFYAPAKFELYVPLGDDNEGLFSQQVRFTVGIGYVFNQDWKGELRYAWQRSRDTIDQDLRLGNHFIELRVSTSIRIKDLIKAR